MEEREGRGEGTVVDRDTGHNLNFELYKYIFNYAVILLWLKPMLEILKLFCYCGSVIEIKICMQMEQFTLTL